MSRSKIAVGFAALLACSIAAAQSLLAGQVEPLTSEAAELKDLHKQHISTLSHLVEILMAQYKAGTGDVRQLILAETELLNARLDSADNPQERIPLLEEQLKMAKQVLDLAQKRFEAGFRVSAADVDWHKALYLDVKIKLVRERAKLKPAAK